MGELNWRNLTPVWRYGEDGVSGVPLHHKTARENPPVTFAIAACETQNGSCSTAKDVGENGADGKAGVSKQIMADQLQEEKIWRGKLGRSSVAGSSSASIAITRMPPICSKANTIDDHRNQRHIKELVCRVWTLAKRDVIG